MTYAQIQKQKADKYMDGIVSGKIIANKWIKLAVKRYQKDIKSKKWIKDQSKVDRVFEFFSYLKINIKDKYVQYEFIPYQAFIIQNLFLFYDKDGDRRFRYLFLFVARKNNKTVFAVALNFYFLIADGVTDPQVLLLATTREQAAIALEYGKNIAKNSPALRKVKQNRYKLNYTYKESTGFIKTLASNASRLDGYNPNAATLDEVHAYPDDSLFNVVKSGVLARGNPLISLITTAGFNLDSLCYELVESSKIILSGIQKDESWLCFLYMLDEGDNYRDPKVWGKSNPALDVVIKMKSLKIEYNSTKIRPSELPNFQTKNLNLFTDQIEDWIDREVLIKASYKWADKKLKGLQCFGGLDLSSTRDLTSFVLLFEIDGLFIAKPYFFLVNDDKKKTRKGGLNLEPWVKKGYIIQCQTKTLDYDLLYQTIENLSAEYDIYSIGYDPFNSALIVPKLEELGINCDAFPQTAMRFNFPLKFLEKQLYDENICMSDNPCLTWNMGNIVLYIDGNENIKIMKNKKLEAVDGAVSLGMAFGQWIAENIDPEKAGLESYLKS